MRSWKIRPDSEKILVSSCNTVYYVIYIKYSNTMYYIVFDEIQSSERWGLKMVELYASGDIVE